MKAFNPVHAIRASDNLSGRDLFREANCATISEQATRDREASADPRTAQIGYFQRAEKRAWEALDDDEKADWEGKASTPAVPTEKSYNATHILR